MKNSFDELTDDKIIKLIKAGDDEAMDYMMRKYGGIVKKEIRTVYLIGAETEDLAQEGMIGLFKAIRDYNDDKGAAFSTFATLCIRRQIKTAITNSNRKKHSPLNTYISINDESETNAQLISDMEDKKDSSNPEELVLQKELKNVLADMIESRLSKYEKSVLYLYLDGLPYNEIAEKLDKSEKSIDNALQRIRNKINIR